MEFVEVRDIEFVFEGEGVFRTATVYALVRKDVDPINLATLLSG